MEIMKHCINAIPQTYKVFTIVTLMTALQKQIGFSYNYGELAPWCIFFSFGIAYFFCIILSIYKESQ